MQSSHCRIVCNGTDSRAFPKLVLSVSKMKSQLSRRYFLTAPQKNSIKFNSQWNFGRKMQRCPAASMTSCTRDFCCWKSGWSSRIRLLQHAMASASHLFLHFPRSRAWYSPRSSRTAFIPLASLRYSATGWLTGKIMGWIIFCPLCICHLLCMCACFPPGFTFMRETSKASSAYAEYPWELSAMNKAW